MDDPDTLTAPPRTARGAEADPLPAAPPARPAAYVASLRARTARSADPPLAELEFVGCDPVPMTREQLRRYEGRFEVWDAGTSTAWVMRDVPGVAHESPRGNLSGLLERIAGVRGSHIARFGAMGLMVRDARGEAQRIMQADQTVYLHPSQVKLPGPDSMVVGEHDYPDVVLEVDNTTDVRRGKLALYEAWGFPEVWVEVPVASSKSRPKGLLPGLTIYRLESGKYRESAVSGAFPGWRASDIHEALNEEGCSERTARIVEYVGRWLGAREGTGPDHDPLLRSLRSESRREGEERGEARGRTEGRAEGEARGEVKGRAGMVRQMLLSRGIDVPEEFLVDAPGFSDLPVAELFEAASACESGRDFRTRIARRHPC